MNINKIKVILILLIGLFLISCRNFNEEILSSISLEKDIDNKERIYNFLYKIGGSGYDWGPSIIDNNGIILAGSTYDSFGASADFLISKLNYQGDVEKAVILGGDHSDVLDGMIKLKNNDFLLFGQSQSMFFTCLPTFYLPRPLIVCLSSSFNVKWVREFPEFSSKFYSVMEDNNKQLFAVGVFYSAEEGVDTYNSLFVKLDNKGDQIWAKKLINNNSNYAIQILSGENNINTVLGQVYIDEKYAIYNFNIDDKGNISSPKLYINEKASLNILKILKTKDEDVIAVGNISVKDNKSILVLRINPKGDILWAKTYGVEKGSAYGIMETNSGDIIVSGFVNDLKYNENKALLLRLSENGDVMTSYVLENKDIKDATYFFDTKKLNNNTFLSCGVSITEKNKLSDYLLINYESLDCLFEKDSFELFESKNIELNTIEYKFNEKSITLKQRTPENNRVFCLKVKTKNQ